MRNNNGKCKECGGKLVTEDGRLVCSICGRPVWNKALKHAFFEEHKEEILSDLDTMPQEALLKKWNIPSGSLGSLKKRWGYHASAPPHRARAPKPGANGQLPSFPEFSNGWQPEVQLAWINAYASLKK